ncbi:MAG: phage holin family protein [bacterium]|nr:phage holin family protein [bacterium]
MRTIAHAVVLIVLNAGGFYVCAVYVPGITLGGGLKEILGVALLFTALNLLVKPILKLVLGPLIVLTLGFGLFILNASMLYVLDKLSPQITIQGIPALLWGTVIMSAVGIVYHLGVKK